MRFHVCAFALVGIFISAPAFCQVTRWVDEKGVVHYEAFGPKTPATSDSFQAKPNALRPIDRSHAGLRLGDDETSFAAARKGAFVGSSGSDGNYYRYVGTLPEGAMKIGLLFGTGRLVFIMIEYGDFGMGGWERLIMETTKNYGPPLGDARTAGWNDGATQLILEREADGNITVTLEDFAAMSKYTEQERAALPKF